MSKFILAFCSCIDFVLRKIYNYNKGRGRKMKTNHNPKKLMILGLCLIVLFMAIGYASFSQNLIINGTSTITSDWNIKITDITVKGFNGSATNAEEPQVENDTTAIFKTNLISPGDSMTYEVTVANDGSIPAKLNELKVEDANNPAILFQVNGISESDILGEHSTTTFEVQVSYNSSITTQPENPKSTLTVTLDYVQNS